jgi:methionyl aminopeptidase
MNIIIKTPEEIELMRASGKILAEVLELMLEKAVVGISTLELDRIAEDLIRQRGGTPAFKGYHGFPFTLCTAVDEIIVHGFPSKDQILKEGDLFTVDCGVIYKEFYSDAARSKIIGSKTTPVKEKLLSTAKKALKKALEIAKPGIQISEMSRAIEKIITEAGFHIIHDLTGHGIGKSLHEDPLVLNFDDGTPGATLRPGMTIAVEPIFSSGSSEMKTLKDGWTIVTADGSPSVQVENTILITPTGNEVLTQI